MRDALRRLIARLRRAPEGAESETVEYVASRAAVMLRAGVPRSRVLLVLADERPEDERLAAVAARAAREGRIAAALASRDAPEWRALAAVWLLAEQSGGPLAEALERYARGLRSLTELRERRGVLLTGPRATVRLVAGLPILALALGWLTGFDPLGVLLTPLGTALIVVGVLLLATGIRWASRLTASVEREDRVAGLEFILLRIGLGGGGSAATARRRIADCVDAVGSEWIGFDALRRGGPLDRVLETARAHGAPLGDLALEEAEAAQTRACAELERSAERLGVRVLIPLGVCALPSFIVLGVLPVLLSMLEPAL